MDPQAWFEHKYTVPAGFPNHSSLMFVVGPISIKMTYCTFLTDLSIDVRKLEIACFVYFVFCLHKKVTKILVYSETWTCTSAFLFVVLVVWFNLIDLFILFPVTR